MHMTSFYNTNIVIIYPHTSGLRIATREDVTPGPMKYSWKNTFLLACIKMEYNIIEFQNVHGRWDLL